MADKWESCKDAEGKWTEEDARVWLLKQLKAHKESSPSQPYLSLEVTGTGSESEPDGKLVLAAFQWLNDRPFEKGKNTYIRRGPTTRNADGSITAIEAQITDTGEELLLKHTDEDP